MALLEIDEIENSRFYYLKYKTLKNRSTLYLSHDLISSLTGFAFFINLQHT